MKRYLGWSVVGAALFVAANAWATAQRGYWAVGGEMFLLLLPLWAWVARAIVEEGSKSDSYDL